MDTNGDNGITIREMEEKDIEIGLQCFTGHGLQESLSTLEGFYKCDPKAFYVAFNNTDNRVIGICGAPVTTHNSGFLGLYGVEKGFQSKGIGKKLFKACMEHIGDRNCGLHAVPDKLDMYKNKAGFGVMEGVTMVDCSGLPKNWENLLKTIDNKTAIEKYDKQNEILISKIIGYDSKVHKDRRYKLLELTLNNEEYNTFAAIDVNSDRVVGYGCIRDDNTGMFAMIGPVYADSDTIAEVLIYNLIKSSPTAQNKSLLYMTMSTSEAGIRIAQKLQLKETIRCERLFTKHPIPVDYQYIYCLFSPNFSL